MNKRQDNCNYEKDQKLQTLLHLEEQILFAIGIADQTVPFNQIHGLVRRLLKINDLVCIESGLT